MEDPPKVLYQSSTGFPASVMSCLLCGEIECERGNHSVNKHWLLSLAPLQWGWGWERRMKSFQFSKNTKTGKSYYPPLIKVSSATWIYSLFSTVLWGDITLFHHYTLTLPFPNHYTSEITSLLQSHASSMDPYPKSGAKNMPKFPFLKKEIRSFLTV